MDEQQELLLMRTRLHDLSEKLGEYALRAEVSATNLAMRAEDAATRLALRAETTAARLEATTNQMDRIEGAVATCNDLLRAQNGRVTAIERVVAVLEDRADANRDAAANATTVAAKWAAVMGAFVAALISGIAAFFGGAK